MASKARALRKRLIKSRADIPKSFDDPKSLITEYQTQIPKESTVDPLQFLESYTTQINFTCVSDFLFTENAQDEDHDNSLPLNSSEIVKPKESSTKTKVNENSVNQKGGTNLKTKNKVIQRFKKVKGKCDNICLNNPQPKTNKKISLKAKELKHKLNVTSTLIQKVNNIVNSVNLPNRCVLDDDVQILTSENKMVPFKRTNKMDIHLLMERQ